ncbi:MAG: hypothetical protein ABSB01_17895 [Streptosporangiaceae bacterium]
MTKTGGLCQEACQGAVKQTGKDFCDAAELAEMLTFLACWLSGSQKQALADSLTAFAGHPAYNTDALCADLHRFAPPRSQRRRRTLRRADAMISKTPGERILRS